MEASRRLVLHAGPKLGGIVPTAITVEGNRIVLHEVECVWSRAEETIYGTQSFRWNSMGSTLTLSEEFNEWRDTTSQWSETDAFDGPFLDEGEQGDLLALISPRRRTLYLV